MRFLLLLDFAAQAVQMRTRAVEHRAVAPESCRRLRFSSGRKSPMPRARAPSSGKRSAAAVEERFRIGGAIEKRDQIEDFARLERRAFDVQLLNRLRDVRQAVEIDANCRALASGLRSRRGAQITHCFAGFGERALRSRRDRLTAHLRQAPPRPPGSRYNVRPARGPAPIPELPSETGERYFTHFSTAASRERLSRSRAGCLR